MVASVVTLGLLFSFAFGSFFSTAPPVTNTDADLRKHVLQLEQAVSDLQSKSQTQDQKYAAILSSVLSKLTESTDELATVKSELKGVNGNYKSLQKELATLTVTLIKNENRTTTLSGELKSTSDTISQLETDVTDIQAKLNTSDANFKPVRSELASIKSEMHEAKENLTSVNSSLMQLEISNKKFNQERFENASSMIHSTERSLTEVASKVNLISSGQANLTSKLSNTENSIRGVVQKQDFLTSKLSYIENNITYLSQKLILPNVAYQVEQRGKQVNVRPGNIIMFDSIKYDSGNYCPTTGEFTAPESGIYLFWVNAVVGSTNINVTVTTQSSMGPLGSTYMEIGPHNIDRLTNIAVGYIEKGERVWLQSTSSRFLVVYKELSSYGGVLLERRKETLRPVVTTE